MHRRYLFIPLLLTTCHFTLAQEGKELDSLGWFDFLKQHPTSGAYKIDHTLDYHEDSTIRIHFINAADFNEANFDSLADFWGAHFDSLADFYRAHFNSLADFSGAQFDFQADFSGAQFDFQADFSQAQFDSLAYFERARFHAPVSFRYAQFNSLADFSDAQFDSLAYFYYAQFDSLADFRYAQFDSLANFREAQFDSRAYIAGAKFDSRADFHRAQFDSQADFRLAQFDSLATFRETQFNSRADFGYAHFDSRADFSEVQFKGKVDFDATTLPDTLVFSGIKTILDMDLTNTRLDSAKKSQGRFCLIDLRDAPIEKFKLRYDKFRVYWPEEIDATEYERLTNVYEALLKNFKDRGYLTSYATLDKEYQAFKDLQNPDASTIKKLLNKANFYWNNYGYNKEWIWGWTSGLLLLFTLINWLALPYLVKEVYPVPMIDSALYRGKPWKRTQFKGIALFWNKIHLNFQHPLSAFFYTTLIFFGLKLSTERINFRKPVGVMLIYTEYLAGLICLGYLANFIISSGLIGK